MLGFLRVLHFALFVFVSSLAYADGNIAVPVTSSRTNDVIFDVVVDYKPTGVKGDEVTEAPGIYSINPANGKRVALVLGNITGVNRAFPGIVAQVTGTNGRGGSLDSIAIVDGRIVLFNKNSRPNKKDSFVVLGQNFNAIDVLSKSKVQIPNIEDQSKLNSSSKVIHSGTVDPETDKYIKTSTFTFSIDSPSPLGTGITFTVTVITPDRSNGKPRILKDSVQVVNYNYLTPKQLEHIVNEDHESIVSSTLVDNFLSQLESSDKDSPLIKKWIARIKATMNKIGKKPLTDAETELFPNFSVRSRQAELASLPAIQISSDKNAEENAVLLQFYDPEKSRWIIARGDQLSSFDVPKNDSSLRIYERSSVTPLRTLVTGKAKYNAAKKRFVDYSVHEHDKNRTLTLLGSSDKTLLLFPGSSGSNKLGVISEDLLSKSKRISTLRHSYLFEGTTYHAVLISTVAANNRKGTTAYTFKEKPDGELELVRKWELTRNYITQNELDERVTQFPIEKSAAVPVFDFLTPPKGAANYLKKPISERTVAMFNLHALVDNSLQSKVYLNTVRQEVVIPAVLEFREYNSQSMDTDNTGFYIVKDGKVKKTPASFVSGTLMYQRRGKNVTESNKFVIGSQKIYFDHKGPNSGKPSLNINLVPVNPNPGRKTSTKRLDLALVLSGHSTTSELQPAISLERLPFPLEAITGVEIIQGKKGYETEVSILFFLRPSTTSPGSSGVYSLTVDVALDSSTKTLSFNGENQKSHLTTDISTPNQLKHRIKEDSKGRYFWVHQLGRYGIEHSKYAVRQLSDPEKLKYPNKDRSINIRHEREFKLKDGSASAYAISDWEVLTEGALQQREGWSWLKDLATKVRKDKKKNKGKASDPRDAFPLLTKFLDTYASADQDKLDSVRKRKIIVVEGRLKETIKQLIGFSVIENPEDGFSLKGYKDPFQFYVFDDGSSAEEISEELGQLAEAHPKSRRMLFADINDISSESELVVNREQDAEEEGFEDSDYLEDFDTQKISRWLLMASDGKARSLKSFNRLKNAAPRVPMFILATPSELRNAKENFSDEATAGVFDNFEIVNDFQTSSWSLWAPDSQFATDELKALSKTPISEEEFQVFPEIEELLKQISSGQAHGRRKILIVPDDLKPLIDKLILARWASKYTKDSTGWHYKNTDLEVFRLAAGKERVSQESVSDNFSAIRGKAKSRNVALLGQLNDILSARRPTAKGSKTFMLKDPASSKALDIFGEESEDFVAVGSGEDDTDRSSNPIANEERIAELEADIANTLVKQRQTGYTDEKNRLEQEIEDMRNELQVEKRVLAELERLGEGSEENDTETFEEGGSENLPHLMWEVASEGLRIQPSRRRGWTLKDQLTDSYATLLIGTESELDEIKAELSGFEERFFDLEEHFDISKIQSPTERTRFNLLESLFAKAEIKSLDYQFILEGRSQDEARSELISHLIYRTEQISRQKGIEPTSAFIKVFTEFRRSLTEDAELRKNGNIDKNYLERMFSKVFPQPLKLDTLPESDPLNVLSSTDAVKMLEDAGYEGSRDLKQRLFNNILSQTRGTDGGRPIPSSTIIFGDTSTGKTFLIKSLFRMLGLNKYDPRKPNNEEADYIIISVQSLTDDDNNTDPSKMTVREAIANIKDLLSQPKGHRAHILIDDGHKSASSDIQRELFSFIQSLFEAEEGMIQVKRKDNDEIREVPVQNINLYMTLNPTSDQDALSKYGAKYGGKLQSKVIAALSKVDSDFDESFLARWTDIINLDMFPRSAKVPALVSSIRGMSVNTDFNVLVSPQAIDLVVGKFSGAHAREFLTPAAVALTRIPQTVTTKAPIYLVAPKSETSTTVIPDDGALQGGENTSKSNGRLDAAQLERAVTDLTQIQAINYQNSRGMLELMSFIMHGFRTQIFNQAVIAAQSSDQLKLRNLSGMDNKMKMAFVMGLTVHMNKNPHIPKNEMQIARKDLSYLDRLIVDEIFNAQRENIPTTPYFPIDFNINRLMDGSGSYGSFIGRTTNDSKNDNRRTVIANTITKIQQIFMKNLEAYLRMSSQEDISNIINWEYEEIRAWFNSIPEEDAQDAFKASSGELLALFKDFYFHMHEESLDEMRDSTSAKDINFYQLSRLFSYIMDRSILNMPWALTAKFAVEVSEVSLDLKLGQRPEYLDYAHSHDFSVFTISTPDFLEEALSNLPEDTDVEKVEAGFIGVCSSVLAGGA